MFVVATEIFAVHFVPKGCVTRRPAVLRRGANINKWVEKILHKVNFCLWESAWHQGLKTSLSVYNANRIRPRRPPWPCLTGWPALGVNPMDEKTGTFLLHISITLCIIWNLQFFLFSTDPKDSRSTRPGSPCTTPSGSGRGVHPEHTWQAVQHWESIQDEKTGTFLLIFLSFGAF